MVDEAEESLDNILSEEVTDEANRYTDKFFLALINLSKGRHLDELMDIVKVFYTARRKTVKGLDINDNVTIHITQQCFNRMAIELPEVICKEVESECKGRDLPVDKIMPVVSQILLSDLSINVDIERLWVLKKLEENKEKEITIKELKDYICYSLALSHKLINGKLNPDMMILLPHILSDNLYNKTGYEGEEIVYHVQEMLKKDELNTELIDLIIREAYAVEQGKEKSYKAFEEQMAQMQKMQAVYGQQGMPQMGPGMPQMDPMMMQQMQGMPPMDPMMMQQMQGMPPMDPMMMGGMPPMPVQQGEGKVIGKKSEEELYTTFMELMQKSTAANPMEDPEIMKFMKENMPPPPQEMVDQNPMMFDPKFIELARKKEEEFIKALPQEFVDKIEKERDMIIKMNIEYEKKYAEQMRQEQQRIGGK